MKRQIRQNVFETNSSSTHAICIVRKDVQDEDIPKFVMFKHGEFGWYFDVYTDIETRASYLYEAIRCLYYDDENKMLQYLKELRSTLLKHGVDCEFDTSKDDRGIENGYIDHGSETREFVDEVIHNEQKLLRYLFGESKIVTGNDNDDNFKEYMDSHDFSEYEVYEKWN